MNRVHRLGLLAAADAAALALIRPRFDALIDGLGAPHAWLAQVGIDRALGTAAGAALWLCAAWLGLGLLALLAARLPGGIGRVAASAGRALLPRALHRMAVGSAGLGVLLAPVAAGAAALPPGQVAHQPATAARAVPTPGWPTDPAAAPSSRPVPAPVWPSGGAPAAAAPPDAAAPTGSPPAGSTPAAAEVRVRRGDSLWLIAARRLGPQATAAQIASEWPRWYAANRSVIGADPALIRPGQVLHVPSDGHPGDPNPKEGVR